MPMNCLDPLKTNSLYDRFLSNLLLLASFEGHSSLTWGSRHRRMIAGEQGTDFSPIPLPGSLMRGITRLATTLADARDRNPLHGRFGLIIEQHTVVVDVAITGAATDTMATLSWVASSAVREAASRVLKRTLDLPPPYVTCGNDEDQSPAVDTAKGRISRNLRTAWNLLQGLIIFTVGLPILPVALLANKYHWFEGKKARERREVLEAGRETIKSLQHCPPPDTDAFEWSSAVWLTFLAYLESENEADTQAVRRTNQEFTAAIQASKSPTLLTDLWDKLDTLGPRSRAFVTRRRFELLEHLGGPIKL